MGKDNSQAYAKTGIKDDATGIPGNVVPSYSEGPSYKKPKKRKSYKPATATPQTTTKKDKPDPNDQKALQQKAYFAAEQAKADIDRLGDDMKDKEARFKDAQKQNKALLTQQQKRIKTQSNWQPSQQREQSTLMALRGRMGNAAYGSGLADLNEGMQRVDDMNDVELINTYKNNMNDAYDNWYQAETDLVNKFNEDLDEANSKIKQRQQQYYADIDNISPGAGRQKYMDAAAKGGKAAVNVGKQDIADLSKEISSLRGKLATSREDNKTYKSRIKAIEKQIKSANGDAKKALKKKKTKLESKHTTGHDDRQEWVDRIKDIEDEIETRNEMLAKTKKNGRVYAGIGDKAIWLPKTSLNPSASFSALKTIKSPSAVNPNVPTYYRPQDTGYGLSNTTGLMDTSTAANQSYMDSLISPLQKNQPYMYSRESAESKGALAAEKRAADKKVTKSKVQDSTPKISALVEAAKQEQKRMSNLGKEPDSKTEGIGSGKTDTDFYKSVAADAQKKMRQLEFQLRSQNRAVESSPEWWKLMKTYKEYSELASGKYKNGASSSLGNVFGNTLMPGASSSLGDVFGKVKF